jgi:hypothetical protein
MANLNTRSAKVLFVFAVSLDHNIETEGVVTFNYRFALRSDFKVLRRLVSSRRGDEPVVRHNSGYTVWATAKVAQPDKATFEAILRRRFPGAVIHEVAA